ncbi:unnamed protein product [Clavelina lepadiformis]|uniref:Uncharacterized protein n=1 Tax=Clavelina lepadiformis TaxID=159417 RepID=A0ABP0G3U1_CLALP
MALVSVQRASTPLSSAASITDQDLVEVDGYEEEDETVSDLPDIHSPTRSNNKKLVRQGSVSENFFAVKGAALILPRQSSLAIGNLQVVKQCGGKV